MGIEEVTLLAIAGSIASILQHSQTVLQAGGLTIPSSWKRIIAFAMSVVAAGVVVLVGEQEGGNLSSSSLTDWVTAIIVTYGASQIIFANVLGRIGVPSKEN